MPPECRFRRFCLSSVAGVPAIDGSNCRPRLPVCMITLDQARLLQTAFFDRDPRRVARALLGKLLIRKTRRGILAGRVVETEAYLGEGDAAAHAVAGKTSRNLVLWGPPGYAYVYFIYGNHFCLNVSCLPDGVPGCVLFRALEPVAGIEEMAKARGIEVRRNSALRSQRPRPGPRR